MLLSYRSWPVPPSPMKMDGRFPATAKTSRFTHVELKAFHHRLEAGLMNIEQIEKCQICKGEFLTEKNIVSIRTIRRSFNLKKRFVCERCYQQWTKEERRLQNILSVGASLLSIMVAIVLCMADYKIKSMPFFFIGAAGLLLCFKNRRMI